MSTPKKIPSTVLKLTVANEKTVFPGEKIELSEPDYKLLSNSGKVKKYEEGDEKKYSVEAPKKKNA